MATAPVESMKSGGALWFTDLTIPDPYYVLPFAACLSFLITIEVSSNIVIDNVQCNTNNVITVQKLNTIEVYNQYCSNQVMLIKLE